MGDLLNFLTKRFHLKTLSAFISCHGSMLRKTVYDLACVMVHEAHSSCIDYLLFGLVASLLLCSKFHYIFVC